MMTPANQTPNNQTTLVEILQTPITTSFFKVEIYVRPSDLTIPETSNVTPPTERTSYEFLRQASFVRGSLHPALGYTAERLEIGRQTASEILDRRMKSGYVQYVFSSLSDEQLTGIKASIVSLQRGLNPAPRKQ